jgi:hypothetical protein
MDCGNSGALKICHLYSQTADDDEMVGRNKCDLQRQHRNLLKDMTSLFSVVNFILYVPFIGCISCTTHAIIWAK